MRFPLNIRKHFFVTKVTEYCHRLPRKVVESPTLEILKYLLDTALGNLLLKRGFGSDSLQRCLTTSIILLFYEGKL